MRVGQPSTLEQLRRSAPPWWVCCRNARCFTRHRWVARSDQNGSLVETRSHD